MIKATGLNKLPDNMDVCPLVCIDSTKNKIGNVSNVGNVKYIYSI